MRCFFFMVSFFHKPHFLGLCCCAIRPLPLWVWGTFSNQKEVGNAEREHCKSERRKTYLKGSIRVAMGLFRSISQHGTGTPVRQS